MFILTLRTHKYISLRLVFPAAIILLSGCASVPEVKPVVQGSSTPATSYALSLQGVPYKYGKESPKDGFDCSGFVKHVYQTQGIMLPRTVNDMALVLPIISKNEVH